MENPWRQTHLMRDRDFARQLIGECKEFIGFGQRLRERLFAEDVCAGFKSGANHGMMLICPAGPHAHKVRLLAFQHHLVISVLPRSFGSLRGSGTSRSIWIGDGDHLNPGMIGKNQVHIMAVVPAASLANKCGVITISCWSFCWPGRWRDRSCD